jgi:predicted RNA-binding protein with TRAM domain
MNYFTKPVEEGRQYEVTIDAEGSKGDGIAHIDGFVVFVNGAKSGAKHKIKITAVRRTFAVGEIVK